jgi:hypothetical protein
VAQLPAHSGDLAAIFWGIGEGHAGPAPALFASDDYGDLRQVRNHTLEGSRQRHLNAEKFENRLPGPTI